MLAARTGTKPSSSGLSCTFVPNESNLDPLNESRYIFQNVKITLRSFSSFCVWCLIITSASGSTVLINPFLTCEEG